MKPSSVLAFVISAVLVSLLCATYLVDRTEASGTIYIRADGRVDPPTAPLVTADNITYTFTSDIGEPIVVERSNIIVDGDNHTLQGSGSGNGLYWSSLTNVTIKNIAITQFYHGIRFDHSSFSTISGNTISANIHSGVYLWASSNATVTNNSISTQGDGINLSSSSNNTVQGNTLHNNDVGIRLQSSSSNTLSGNNITGHRFDGIHMSSSTGNVVSGNTIASNANYGVYLWASPDTRICANAFVNNGLLVARASEGSVVVGNFVNGKPLVYLTDASDVVVGEAGQVVLVRCNNITVANLTLSNASIGLQLWQTNNSKILGNSIAHNLYGIRFVAFSTNNTVRGNSISANAYGVLLEESEHNELYANHFLDNAIHAYVDPGYINHWDRDDPLGGNYWSDYEDRYPNATELNGSGLWDTPYMIDETNQDNYPLIPEYAPLLVFLLFATASSAATLHHRNRERSEIPSSPLPTGEEKEDAGFTGQTMRAGGR